MKRTSLASGLRRGLSLGLALAALTATAAAAPVAYKVDTDHSGVHFTVRHFVTNVPGRFKDFEGTIRYDRQNPAASSVAFRVQAASIDTDNADRDNHLRSPDFFDVEKFPTLTFTSTAVQARDAGTLQVTGDFTLHGVTRTITIPVEVLGTVATPRGEKAGFETTFTVNRKDFGITWNRTLDAGGAILGEDVKVTVAIEADRQAEPAAK
jgi:polyisoprenoid-binding protein YceI